MTQILNDSKEGQYPFIVAVKGQIPFRGNEVRSQSKARILPSNEFIVGFALATPFSFGFSGKFTGRSRTTTDLQFYVHADYTRKGIGRCLLDRLVACMSFGYAGR